MKQSNQSKRGNIPSGVSVKIPHEAYELLRELSEVNKRKLSAQLVMMIEDWHRRYGS